MAAARNKKKARVPKIPTLVVTEHPGNGGLVVATEGRARFVDQINRAIRTSKTWGDLRDRLPKGEYARLARQIADAEGSFPRRTDPFEGEVPGQSEGDYPDWLQAEMDQILPDSILSTFGEEKSTMLNGNYYHIDPEKRVPLVAALKKLGFRVVRAGRLDFY
jgi:hypothetical protein